MSTTSETLEPFATRWVGENYNAPWPIVLYGLMLFASVAYFILTKALIAHHGASRFY